jgi:hypothetical protein
MEWWQTFGIAPQLGYFVIAGVVGIVSYAIVKLKARPNQKWDNDSTNNYTSKGKPVLT